MFHLGGVIGAVSGGFLIGRFGSRPTMLTMTGLAIVGAIVLSLMSITSQTSVFQILAMLAVHRRDDQRRANDDVRAGRPRLPHRDARDRCRAALSIGRAGAILSGMRARGRSTFEAHIVSFGLMAIALSVTFVALAHGAAARGERVASQLPASGARCTRGWLAMAAASNYQADRRAPSHVISCCNALHEEATLSVASAPPYLKDARSRFEKGTMTAPEFKRSRIARLTRPSPCRRPPVSTWSPTARCGDTRSSATSSRRSKASTSCAGWSITFHDDQGHEAAQLQRPVVVSKLQLASSDERRGVHLPARPHGKGRSKSRS